MRTFSKTIDKYDDHLPIDAIDYTLGGKCPLTQYQPSMSEFYLGTGKGVCILAREFVVKSVNTVILNTQL